MDSYAENDIKKGQTVPDLFGVAKKIQQTCLLFLLFEFFRQCLRNC